MDFDRILSSVPVNRTAAIVTSGSPLDEPASLDQKRVNLAALANQIERAIRATADPKRKKWLGLQKLEVQNALHALPRKWVRDRDLAHFIVEVVKERITKGAFNSILDEAGRRLAASRQSADMHEVAL